MLTRRAVLTGLSVAAGSMLGAGARAQDRFDQDALLDFVWDGDVTLMHLGDVQGKLVPHYDRPAEVILGPGDTDDVPYLTGEAFRIRYGIGGTSPMDYAHTHEEFINLAKAYGKIGGLDRVATMINAIRSQHPGALLLAGAQTYEGSLSTLRSNGQGMRQIITALRPDAIAVRGADSEVTASYKMFTRSGAQIAVLSLDAIPLGTSADTHMTQVRTLVDEARGQGADVIVCLSDQGYDIDLAVARAVDGIDLILAGRGKHALPEPEMINGTYVAASGGQGRFVSRLDLDIREGKVTELRQSLIPMFSELIRPDPEVAALITAARKPYALDLAHHLGHADALLYSRGTLHSSWDDVICAALMANLDAQIALSPAVSGGSSVLPDQQITREDVFNLCGYAEADVYRRNMTGAELSELLENEADLVFNPDPFKRSGRDMMRVGGIGYELTRGNEKGNRIKSLTLRPSGDPIQAEQTYSVASWGANNEPSGGPPLWDVLENYISDQRSVGSTSGAPLKVTDAK